MVSLLEIARSSGDPDEWRLINGALADIRDGLNVFAPHRLKRKVTVFGSARTAPDDPAYRLAQELAVEAVGRGFEVMTGAGGGIMEAANSGAGCDNSIGLNVELPFEQHANRYVNACEGRLLHFRYFFTRKLFFLRESDALVVMPGGFGTFDELFESLTLIQTGRTMPIPLVMLAPPGDSFWREWLGDMHEALVSRGLISPEDTTLLKQASSAAEAMAIISHFYRVFHGAQYAEDNLELLLHGLPSPYWGQDQVVTGLLTGSDLLEGLKGCDLGDTLLLPAVMLRQGEPLFLDDQRLESIAAQLPVPLQLVQGADEIVAACLGNAGLAV